MATHPLSPSAERSPALRTERWVLHGWILAIILALLWALLG
jgi:hypothetical protein